jgi:DNA-binding transcriptional ArsR family regulator
MADIFDIVADSTRREILQVLLEAQATGSGEVAVSQIVLALELSQPTVSKHLKVLRDSGLVKVREEGQHRYYHLDSSPLEEVDEWLFPFLGTAEEPEDTSESEAVGAASSVGFGATGLSESQKEFASSVGKVAAGAAARAAALASRVKR